MTITLITKRKSNGEYCAKSAEVIADLTDRGLYEQIDQFVIADELNPESEGYRLAAQYQVSAAPFFLVAPDAISATQPQVYQAYHRFLQEVFHQAVDPAAELMEIMSQNPDLDYI